MGGGRVCVWAKGPKEREREESMGGEKDPHPPSPSPTRLDLTCRWKRRRPTSPRSVLRYLMLISPRYDAGYANQPTFKIKGTRRAGQIHQRGREVKTEDTEGDLFEFESRPPEEGIFESGGVIQKKVFSNFKSSSRSSQVNIPATPGAMPRVLIYLTACN